MWSDSATIAKRLGITKPYVNQLLDFLAAPKPVRDLVSSGKVSATLAVETIRKHGVKQATKMLKDGLAEAEAKGKTRATAKHVKAAVKKADPAPAAPTPPAQQDLVSMTREQVVENGLEFVMLQPNEDRDELLVSMLAHITGADAELIKRRLNELTGDPL